MKKDRMDGECMSDLNSAGRSVTSLCNLRGRESSKKRLSKESLQIGLVLFLGSWNRRMIGKQQHVDDFLKRLAHVVLVSQGFSDSDPPFSANVLVDRDEASMQYFLNEDRSRCLPPPPAELPVLAIVLQTATMDRSVWRYVALSAADLITAWDPRTKCWSSIYQHDSILFAKVLRSTRNTMRALEQEYLCEQHKAVPMDDALRIFIAGDRSSVGKSSICLGILGSLVANGYAPETLAYIKPATQSESTQLIQLYCEQQGIHCIPVGPLVYYRGFTRAFLAGETESTEQLLAACGHAVDYVARGKKVVMIDGVGFPSVGSICGTSNAAVALSCGYPIIDRERSSTTGRLPMGVCLVGGSGVGAAVDAFNLNATFFEKAGVPVLGAIFNKLSEHGYYSLENCRNQVSAYFKQSEEQRVKGRRPYGFLPLFSLIGGKNAVDHVQEFIAIFGQHIDVVAVVAAAVQSKQASFGTTSSLIDSNGCSKKSKYDMGEYKPTIGLPPRSRSEIEQSAILSGAAPSA